MTLADATPQGFNGVFDRLRAILHEGAIDKRVQYTIEALFAERKSGFGETPAVPRELDLIDAEDQIPHEDISLDDELDVEESLNQFHFDPQFEEHERMYANIRAEILGEESSSGSSSGSGGGTESDDDESDSDDGDNRAVAGVGAPNKKKQKIEDATETNMIAFRRTVYLTIMSSLDFEECKLFLYI